MVCFNLCLTTSSFNFQKCVSILSARHGCRFDFFLRFAFAIGCKSILTWFITNVGVLFVSLLCLHQLPTNVIIHFVGCDAHLNLKAVKYFWSWILERVTVLLTSSSNKCHLFFITLCCSSPLKDCKCLLSSGVSDGLLCSPRRFTAIANVSMCHTL
jgi:hypothetical protein